VSETLVQVATGCHMRKETIQSLFKQAAISCLYCKSNVSLVGTPLFIDLFYFIMQSVIAIGVCMVTLSLGPRLCMHIVLTMQSIRSLSLM